MEQFEVIFYDDDKTTVLDRQMVNAGEPVEYKGNPPEKETTNGVKYTFKKWDREDEMASVKENLAITAIYSAETLNATKEENALLDASLENAENTNLNATVEAGQKLNEQQKALAKDSRTAEQIVNEVLENGSVEIGQEANKDNIER